MQEGQGGEMTSQGTRDGEARYELMRPFSKSSQEIMRTGTTIVLEGPPAREMTEIESSQRLPVGWQLTGYRGKEKCWNPR